MSAIVAEDACKLAVSARKERTVPLLRRGPWLWPFAAVVAFTGRWIWVAGIGDYGWTYEAAYRIAHGEVQYKDFLSTLPPLASYALAGFLWLFGDSLWWFAVHLYLWWFLSLWVGWRLMRLITSNPMLLASAGVLAVALSAPAGTLGHAYNYAATTLAGLEMLLLVRSLQDNSLIRVFGAGVAAGLCVFAKQNVGVAMSAASGVILIFQFMRDRSLCPLAALAVGWLVGFVPIAAYFIVAAGPREFLLQTFHDGTAGKGGLWTILGRALPRLVLSPDTPHRRLSEALLSSAMLALFCFWGVRAYRRRSVPGPKNPLDRNGLLRLLLLWFAVMAEMSVWSLQASPSMASLQSDLGMGHFYTGMNLFLSLVYLASTVAFGFCLAGLRGESDLLALLLLVGALLASTATSLVFYLAYCAPVVVPVLVASLHRARLIRTAHLLPILVLFLYLAPYFLAPGYDPCFVELTKLPEGTPLAGLCAPKSAADYFSELLKNVTPAIRGHRVLWLCGGGPHSMFGGSPVKNIASIYRDTYHSRQEQTLWREWHLHPPDYVFFGNFTPASHAALLERNSIQAWLNKDFVRVWAGASGTSLWRHDSQETHAE
jgi:hypothetical protein